VTVRVRLFAILRDRARTSEVMLELPSGARVSDASVKLGQKFPDLPALLTRVAFAVNQQYVPAETELKDGDELAVIPPVSGG
jgi:molybdopterin synthase catalytic subunit